MVVALEGDGPEGAEPASLVCAVGPEAGSGETLSAILETASESKCPVSALSSSARMAVAAVPRQSGEALLNALHARLIESRGA
jgi:aspartokinase